MNQELDNDELVPIMYSNEKLKMLLENSDLPKADVFQKYIESLNYDQIPEFPSGMKWFNTSEPLTFMKHLKGKLILLDFFTYCCINCMHILPDLKEIEHTFSVEDGLVVIGVHSAKFDNERHVDNVANAVLRYGIEHPVVNDELAKMWKQCDIHCWPTLLLINPDGKPLVMLMGEGHRDTLKLYIKHFLDYYKSKISKRSLPIAKNSTVIHQKQGPLLFPGKISAFGLERLCVSDSGNNRLLFIDNFNTAKQSVLIVGSPYGQLGFRDGGLDDALFNQPQGIVFLSKDIVFVADTENHAIRRVDFQLGTVATVAGNGSPSNDRNGGRIGTQQGISSPWDLEIFVTGETKPVLLVAMAGMHQIWAVFLEDTKWWKDKEYMAGMVVCIAGSGREENRNNNYPNNAAFAQPSGLAYSQDNKTLYIADSESSTVRKMSLIDGKVTAVVGGDFDPNNLFAFGDKDGNFYDAKLQHCIGLALGNRSTNKHKVFVADTYNHKIKVINTFTRDVITVKSLKFNEPCGLCQTPDGKLYIADTNNHLIKIGTLNEAETEIIKMDTLKIHNASVQPLPDTIDRVELEPFYNLEEIALNGKRNIKFNVQLDNLDWTAGAPHIWSARSKLGHVKVSPTNGKQVEKFSISLQTDTTETKHDDIEITFSAFTCLKDLCFNRKFVVAIPVSVREQSDTIEDIQVNVIISEKNVSLFQENRRK